MGLVGAGRSSGGDLVDTQLFSFLGHINFPLCLLYLSKESLVKFLTTSTVHLSLNSVQ